MKKFGILCLGLLLWGSTVLKAEVRLPHFFSSNMVLQREMPIRIWGKADKKEAVTVIFHETTITVTADKRGDWQVELPRMKAGGPYFMQIKAGKQVIGLENILIGDVWICSGQSNMEFGLNGVNNAQQEIAASDLPEIRLLNVPKVVRTQEQSDIETTQWTACNPQTSPRFTAVGYFFAKNLQPEIGVPVGLIHSSWGGTDIETWTSWKTSVATNEMYKQYAGKDIEKAMGYSAADIERYKKALERDKGLAQKWYSLTSEVKDWKKIGLPRVWDGELANEDGIVWFRRTIELPAEFAGKAGKLNLGQVDDEDISYVNGEKVGEIVGWSLERSYEVSSGILKAGKNTIVVRVKDIGGTGGMLGKKEDLFLEVEGRRYSLAGLWEYKPSVLTSWYNATAIWPNSFASLLYNGMIHPLVGYGIKGVIWYQGENNAARAYQYRTLFPALIQDWRQLWGYDFPFLWVQLANFMAIDDQPRESDWAELREAQNMTLRLPKTGQAVITDIGEAFDIHPKNKQDVGKRLAQAALQVAYEKDVFGSGPVYKTMQIEGNKAVLTFDRIGEGLSTIEKNRYGYVNGFTIAGADGKFVWAKAYIDGNKVVVFNENITAPVAVRYGWSNNPYDNNLVNSAGLLASPFRTDQWKGITEKQKQR